MPRVVAAFDFDKTLSTRDNVVPFLRRVTSRRATLRALARAAPLVLARRREDAKRHALEQLLGGRRATDVRAIGDEFAHEVIDRHLRDDTVARAAWHRAQGHEIVLVSASLDLYLDRIGELLGVDAVLCTRLGVAPDGVLTGAIVGENVRRAEKARRLDDWLGATGGDAYVYAYGDSAGDRELLARADHPVRVRRAPLSVSAAEAGGSHLSG